MLIATTGRSSALRFALVHPLLLPAVCAITYYPRQSFPELVYLASSLRCVSAQTLPSPYARVLPSQPAADTGKPKFPPQLHTSHKESTGPLARSCKATAPAEDSPQSEPLPSAPLHESSMHAGCSPCTTQLAPASI